MGAEKHSCKVEADLMICNYPVLNVKSVRRKMAAGICRLSDPFGTFAEK
jgi:hypothetical protein